MEKPKTHRMSRAAASLAAAAAVMPLVDTSADASAIEREIARRAALVADADLSLIAGREAYGAGDYQEAVNQYRRALELLPNGSNFDQRRQEYTAHLADASVELSKLSVKRGDLQGARELIDEVIEQDPDNLVAKQQQQYLDDPIRTNQALTPEHAANVDAVRRHLYTAQSAYDLADFDMAEKEYHKVLRIDRYNTAARRGLEQVHRAKSDYYRSAYDEARAQLLSQVDAAWEQQVPSLVSPVAIGGGGDVTSGRNSSVIREKLATLIVPEFRMNSFTVEEGIEQLRQFAFQLDVDSPQAQRGINIFVRSPRSAGGDSELDAETLGAVDSGSKVINEINLTNVPLGEILRLIAEEAGLRVKVTEYAVEVLPLSTDGEELVPARFEVPADFRASLAGGSGGGGGEPDPFGGGGDSGGGNNLSIQELLQQAGIPFPEGSSASLIGGTTLSVTNTAQNIDSIEQIVIAERLKLPKQVKITTKFVEVAQENTDELGFDWLVQPFGVTPSTVFLGGGTVGAGAARAAGDFINQVDGTLINPGASGGTSTSQGIVTSGLRNGDFAINRNSIDAVLNNPNRTAQVNSVAPGILSLTGIFTDGQVQMIMRGLQQRKGTDIMTAPSVMVRATGEQATIEVVREFIYPTEYEPPELPNEVGIGGGFGGLGGGLGGAIGGAQSAGIFPVTPATPTAFDTRKTGVTLEIEPTLDANSYTIDLQFTPEIVEFEGFINYGAPIQSPGTDAFGNPAPVTITENRIEMPVFSSRRVQTAITIYDGHTVAVGGLMREDVQMVRDQVPILGDVPLIGRLFKSESENRIKSNLIIFVTAEVIDASGQRFNAEIPGSSSDLDVPTGVLPGI